VYCHALIPLNLIGLFGQFRPEALTAQSVKFIVADSVQNAEKQILNLLGKEVLKFKTTI
jgi:hypothetical protein